jgi:hypothetical protein
MNIGYFNLYTKTLGLDATSLDLGLKNTYYMHYTHPIYSTCTINMEDIAQAQLRRPTQAEERFARWMQRRERNLEPIIEGTVGYQSSKGNTAQQSRQIGHLQYGSWPLTPNPGMKMPCALEPTFEQLKYKLDQAKNHLEKEELLEEQKALRLGA